MERALARQGTADVWSGSACATSGWCGCRSGDREPTADGSALRGGRRRHQHRAAARGRRGGRAHRADRRNKSYMARMGRASAARAASTTKARRGRRRRRAASCETRACSARDEIGAIATLGGTRGGQRRRARRGGAADAAASRSRSSTRTRRPGSRSSARSGVEEPWEGEIGVVDVGGGSTEIVVGSVADGITWSRSFRLGSGRLSDAFLEHDPPRPFELGRARRLIEETMPPPDEVPTGRTRRGRGVGLEPAPPGGLAARPGQPRPGAAPAQRAALEADRTPVRHRSGARPYPPGRRAGAGGRVAAAGVSALVDPRGHPRGCGARPAGRALALSSRLTEPEVPMAKAQPVPIEADEPFAGAARRVLAVRTRGVPRLRPGRPRRPRRHRAAARPARRRAPAARGARGVRRRVPEEAARRTAARHQARRRRARRGPRPRRADRAARDVPERASGEDPAPGWPR